LQAHIIQYICEGMKNAPSVSEPLLAYINQKFPERCPDPQDSDREIWMKSGERRVFRHLEAVYKFQNKNKIS